MAFHMDLGKKGEQLAEEFLSGKGFIIRHRNWRHRHFEIDIIAEKNGLLHFVEVKCRSNGQYGMPEEAVTKKKIRDLLQAADQYLFLHPEHKNFRLDILSIVFQPQGPPEYFFIEDVYV